MNKGFYVTLKDGERTAWLLGPFRDHEKAKAAVDATAKKAEEFDARAFWYARGTSSITTEGDATLPNGKLNAFLPELLEA